MQYIIHIIANNIGTHSDDKLLSNEQNVWPDVSMG